jgi:dihydrolipoamide dehydrogenase
VEVLAGRASLVSPGQVTVGLDDGSAVEAETMSVVVAAGARWEPPALPGIGADRILTADLVQALDAVPSTSLVLGGGPADTAFAVEYAFLLAALGSAVTLALPGPLVVPGLDGQLDPAVTAALEALGIDVLRCADAVGGDTGKATVAHSGGESVIGAEIVVVADRRVPTVDGIGLAAAGVDVVAGAVRVDGSCRTSAEGVLAAGDVTGGRMLTAAALHMGGVAGVVAAGGTAHTRLAVMPHVLHTLPGIGWIGHTEDAARRSGAEVGVAIVDLATNARAVAMGGRDGFLKLIADTATGELLGVHVVGPDSTEIVAVAATAMQAELTVADLAATVPWHPSLTESLADAARQLA